MTAMISSSARTKTEKLEEAKAKWIEEAVSYMLFIGIYAQDEVEGATDLAENLYYHSLDERGEVMYSAHEAVDEELTYWGE